MPTKTMIIGAMLGAAFVAVLNRTDFGKNLLNG